MGRPRVVVTGLGLVTPLAVGVEETWRRALAGQSGIGPITRFDASRLKTRIAGEVRGFQPSAPPGDSPPIFHEPFIQYALAAGSMAWAMAGLPQYEPRAAWPGAGVVMGVGMGGIHVLEDHLLRRGGPPADARMMNNLLPHYAALALAGRCRLGGPALSVSTACAASTHALGQGLGIIQRGAADVMLCGGADAIISPTILAGFNAAHALSTRNDDPAGASRPFDLTRDGFVMGEGAGVLVLESLDHARARGAAILTEVKGYGMNCDAYHPTAPGPQGEGYARCMRLALDDARLGPEDIGYINAHGTSTKLNDSMESRAIRAVFGPAAGRVAVSSTKSMTGHLIGAAGAVEAAFCVLALRDQVLPPTINLNNPDPECDLDYVPGQGRPASLAAAMSNSFAFGGHNGCLIFTAWEP